MTCWCGLRCKPTWDLNSNVFLRYECRNGRISSVFLKTRQSNEWTCWSHVGQTKKLSKQTGPTCWSYLLDNMLANMLSGLRRPLVRTNHKGLKKIIGVFSYLFGKLRIGKAETTLKK